MNTIYFIILTKKNRNNCIKSNPGPTDSDRNYCYNNEKNTYIV